MTDQANPTAGMDEQALRAEIARLTKINQSLMDRVEADSNIQDSDSDFNLFHAAVTIDDQVRRRTGELEAALQESEKSARSLRESEEQYRGFFLGAMVPMLLIEPTTGRIVDANAAAEKFYGYVLEQFKGMNIDQINTLNREQVAQEMAGTSRGEKSCFEFRHRLANGEIRDVEVYSGSVNLKNHPLLYSIVHDITERKRAEKALQESEENMMAREREFRTLTEHSPDNIARYDCTGRTLYVNPAFERVLGRSAEFMIGKTPMEIIPGTPLEAYQQAILRVGDTGEAMSVEQTFVAGMERPRIYSFNIVAETGVNGIPVDVLAIGRDITSRKSAEENLRITASVFGSSREGITITDANARILDVNPAFTTITGFTREEVIGRNPKILSSGRHDKSFYAVMWQALERERNWRGEIWNRRKTGEIYAELLSIAAICDDDGKVQRYVGVFSDINYLKTHEAELSQFANYDALTGVPNRRLLVDRMAQATARAKRTGKMLAVCLVDLDGFKQVNDQYGHEAGDQLLVEVTHRLQGVLRAEDTLARLGGDEFVVLFNDLDGIAECRQILDRILDIIATPIILSNHPVTISASIGVTSYLSDSEDCDTLLRHADRAMYVAKRNGKGRYHAYDPKLD